MITKLPKVGFKILQISLQISLQIMHHFSFQVVLAIAKSSFCWACACKTRIGCRNVGHRLGMWVTGYELSTCSDAVKAPLLSINIVVEYVGENKGEQISKELYITWQSMSQIFCNDVVMNMQIFTSITK